MESFISFQTFATVHYHPKGLDPMVESEEFFTIGQGSILVRALPGAMGAP
jgi:hypothetical protein